MIGALTADGKVYTHMQRTSFDGVGIVRFLKHLLRQIPGKLLVIWDGLPAHRGEAVRTFLASGAAQRIQLKDPGRKWARSRDTPQLTLGRLGSAKPEYPMTPTSVFAIACWCAVKPPR